jgi:hypothetical protein
MGIRITFAAPVKEANQSRWRASGLNNTGKWQRSAGSQTVANS